MSVVALLKLLDPDLSVSLRCAQTAHLKWLKWLKCLASFPGGWGYGTDTGLAEHERGILLSFDVVRLV